MERDSHEIKRSQCRATDAERSGFKRYMKEEDETPVWEKEAMIFAQHLNTQTFIHKVG